MTIYTTVDARRIPNFYSTFVAVNRNPMHNQGLGMHKASAKLKTVRSFNRLLGLAEPDRNFHSWKDHTQKPLMIEVGCGAGLHPIKWAQEHPNKRMVAIERTKHKFLAFQGRLKNHELDNIYPVNQDALYWIPENIQPLEVDEYFFLYPNPYPKERQANKRWHRNPFFEFILKTLKKGGSIHFASNEQSYIEECLWYSKDHWGLQLTERVDLNNQAHFKARTHFEKKYLANQEPCTQLSFTKESI